MPTINEACLPHITSDTTLEERTAIYLGLRKQGWPVQQAAAVTGLQWVFDDERGDSVRIVELEPYPMVKQ